MLNQVVEDWFAESLEYGLDEMTAKDRLGIPTVHVDCEFQRASQIGEILTFELDVQDIGTSSFTLNINAHVAGDERLHARVVLVYITLEPRRQALPIPAAIRAKMQRYVA